MDSNDTPAHAEPSTSDRERAVRECADKIIIQGCQKKFWLGEVQAREWAERQIRELLAPIEAERDMALAALAKREQADRDLEKMLDEADAPPLPESRIKEMVAYATDPLARQLMRERDAARAEAGRLKEALQAMADNCFDCDGDGTVELGTKPCPVCAPARKALEG